MSTVSTEKKKNEGGGVDPAVRMMLHTLAPMSRCPFELFLWMQYSKEALTPGDDEAYCALFDKARATMDTDATLRKLVTAVWNGSREGKSVKQINDEFLALVAAPEVEEQPSPPQIKRIEAGADIAESNNDSNPPIVDEQSDVKTEPPVEKCLDPGYNTTTSVVSMPQSTPKANDSGSPDDDDLMKMQIGKRKDEQKWSEKRLNDREKLRQQLSKFDGEAEEKLKDLRWTVIVSVAFCQKTSRASCPPAELSAVTFDLHRGLIGRRSWHLRLIGTLADDKQQADMKSRRDNKKRGHFLSINAKDSRCDYDQVWRELIEFTADSQLILVHPEEEFDQTVAALKSLYRIANEIAKDMPKLPSSKLVLLEDALTVLTEHKPLPPVDNQYDLLSARYWTENKDGGGRWFCDYHRAVTDANLYGCAAARAVSQLCGVMCVLRHQFDLPMDWFEASTVNEGTWEFGFLRDQKEDDNEVNINTADAEQPDQKNITDETAVPTSTVVTENATENQFPLINADVSKTPPAMAKQMTGFANSSPKPSGFGRGRIVLTPKTNR